jgi:hypothetical protein
MNVVLSSKEGFETAREKTRKSDMLGVGLSREELMRMTLRRCGHSPTIMLTHLFCGSLRLTSHQRKLYSLQRSGRSYCLERDAASLAKRWGLHILAMLLS